MTARESVFLSNGRAASTNNEFVSVAERIWRIAESAPDVPAIVSEHEQITFGDLIARASLLAASLNSAREKTNPVVAVATADCAQMVIAALAAWRAGFAYLPVSPAEAPERLQHILSEAEVNVVATNHTTASLWKPARRHLCLIDDLPAKGQAAERGNAVWRIAPQDLAYVIYTSGSTGQAKGVAVTQANLRHLVNWYAGAFHPTPRDRGTQFAALTFDAAVLEIWPVLAAGGTLCVPDRSIALMPQRLRDYILAEQITLCFAATPIAEQLISLQWPSNARLRFLLTGADTLRAFPTPELPFQLVNNYGPTECTVLATSGIITCERNGNAIPSIGRPIPGTDVYILNTMLEPVRDGDWGQICIAGGGVAAGYLGRPDLTQERFVQLPEVTNSRLYLTGDVGCKLPNGEFQFRGRLDEQIKIRGFRIEPNEVIAALRSHAAVSAAAVAAIGTQEHKQLAAYVVLKTHVTEDELRAHLAMLLSPYLIPAVFVRLRELPLTANGKVNLAALPPPDASNGLEQDRATGKPGNEIEVQVAAILSSLLGGRELGLQDNFFRLGGNSLLAAQIIERVRKAFSVDLPLRTIFESPTVAALSRQIASLRSEQSSARSSSLVRIQGEGSRPAFFCVHAHGWDLQVHHRMADVLGSDQPFYGLQPSHLKFEGKLAFSVEDLAASYIAELRKIQPVGPYHLGGYCFGGIVAFEMAQQLLARGEDVALLALIDTFFPGEQADFPIKPLRRTLFWFVDTYLGEFLWRTSREKFAYLSYFLRYRILPGWRLRWARSRLSGTGAVLEGWAELEQANRRANHTYVPKSYPGRIVLFWGGAYPFRAFNDRRLGWSEVAEEGLEVHVVPGDQRTFLSPRLGYSAGEPSPTVTIVAQKLRRCLQRCGVAPGKA